jgi:hypothetical protein
MRKESRIDRIMGGFTKEVFEDPDSGQRRNIEMRVLAREMAKAI